MQLVWGRLEAKVGAVLECSAGIVASTRRLHHEAIVHRVDEGTYLNRRRIKGHTLRYGDRNDEEEADD